MSTSVTSVALPACLTPGTSTLAARLGRWLRRRRQAVTLAWMDARLCEDAGLALPAPRPLAARLVIPGGG
ncbi:hypothetical protein [Paracraurococcus lichenis]|uniref:DUF1127 domain-containing protein n=1 Tax=Paracraurococcus lichenis TaxID=3064888 RepID=A0ABT9DS33_9PROT|nr:hypothetical protein [Paracraurococcus sp. LOR1-02]MDO9706715.1 hypothetical protein [Paracraurococcus sp. LOR1-02]